MASKVEDRYLLGGNSALGPKSGGMATSRCFVCRAHRGRATMNSARFIVPSNVVPKIRVVRHICRIASSQKSLQVSDNACKVSRLLEQAAITRRTISKGRACARDTVSCDCVIRRATTLIHQERDIPAQVYESEARFALRRPRFQISKMRWLIRSDLPSKDVDMLVESKKLASLCQQVSINRCQLANRKRLPHRATWRSARALRTEFPALVAIMRLCPHISKEADTLPSKFAVRAPVFDNPYLSFAKYFYLLDTL